MGFDKNKFIKQGFEYRTDNISVPGLSEWFDDDEPIWTVRNLTGSEMINAQEAAAKNKNISALVEALTSSNSKDKTDALKEFVGVGDKIPDELAKRLEMFVSASIAPVIDLQIAIKFAKNFPVEFMQITNKIIVITGLGASAVKPEASGTIQA